MSDTIDHLTAIIEERKAHPQDGSYTCQLFTAGKAEILKKVGEEAVEVIVAGSLQGQERLVYESADLIYHLLVLLSAEGLSWVDVEAELRRRFKA